MNSFARKKPAEEPKTPKKAAGKKGADDEDGLTI